MDNLLDGLTGEKEVAHQVASLPMRLGIFGFKVRPQDGLGDDTPATPSSGQQVGRRGRSKRVPHRAS